MTVMYLFLSLAIIALVLYIRRHPQYRPSRVIDALSALCMIVCSVLLTLPLPFDNAIVALLGASLGGLGVAWVYCRWGIFYAKLDIHFSAPLIFLSMAVGSFGKLIVDLLPPLPATLILVCMPLCAYMSLYVSLKKIDGASALATSAKPARYFNQRTLGSLARLAVGIVVFSFTVGIIQSMPHETAPSLLVYPFVIHICEIIFALALLFWILSLKRKVAFSQLWSIVLILMITGLVFAPYFANGIGGYIYELIGVAQTALIIVAYLALSDIARHSIYPPMVVFGAGWITYSLPFALGDIVGTSVSSFEFLGVSIVSIIIWILVVAMFFFLNDSTIGNRLIFMELNDTDEGAPAQRVIEVQRSLDKQETSEQVKGLDSVTISCDALAKEYSLTPREREILDLIARGRSRAYIADAFFISENTVHGHIKRIYAKFDVHSKQELIDKVETHHA